MVNAARWLADPARERPEGVTRASARHLILLAPAGGQLRGRHAEPEVRTASGSANAQRENRGEPNRFRASLMAELAPVMSFLMRLSLDGFVVSNKRPSREGRAYAGIGGSTWARFRGAMDDGRRSQAAHAAPTRLPGLHIAG